MPKRSTVKAICILRRLIERFREKKKDLHMAFINLGKKTNNEIPGELIWHVLEKKHVHNGM